MDVDEGIGTARVVFDRKQVRGFACSSVVYMSRWNGVRNPNKIKDNKQYGLLSAKEKGEERNKVFEND